MRRPLVLALDAIVMTAPLLVVNQASADVPFAQRVSLVKDGPAFTFYVSKNTGFSGAAGRPTFAKSSHKIDLNVYRLEEREPNYDYYFVDTDSRLSKKSGSNAGSMKFTAWTDSATSSSSYTKSVSSKKSSCVTVSGGISGGMGPVGASATVSKDVLCGKAATGKLSTSSAGPIGAYSINAPALAKHIDFKKFVRVKPHKHPSFHVRVSGPCDYENSVHDLIRTTCTDSYTLGYAGRK